MKVEFNRTGAERKLLVTAISEILERKAKYLGMPSAAYDKDRKILLQKLSGSSAFRNGGNEDEVSKWRNSSEIKK
ncbi:hypothetical protein O6R05_05315 [Peptoniphilus equinus]|uniref:Uncharacterized protein n=1 Tax=Peptoniphilus equinus TaxID=3016343 RepID=A0ABY7QRL3_9FIRM|nr:hypothetical protein [Peptoniphilus equinus]WBW49429.1 hypothetical protein O6R05_05315 [Peptoniphilus equinus]